MPSKTRYFYSEGVKTWNGIPETYKKISIKSLFQCTRTTYLTTTMTIELN